MLNFTFPFCFWAANIAFLGQKTALSGRYLYFDVFHYLRIIVGTTREHYKKSPVLIFFLASFYRSRHLYIFTFIQGKIHL